MRENNKTINVEYMIRFGIVIIMCLMCCSSKAIEVLDTSYLHVNYEAKLKMNKEKKHINRNVVLEIGKDVSVCYDSKFRQFIALDDSLKMVRASVGEWIRTMENNGTFGRTVSFAVYKHLPAMNELTYTDEIFRYLYYYEQELPAIDWQMQDADSVVCGYSCSKAVGEWRGRRWTVWYSMDIPIDDGPWKLQGLPGLILHAEDAQGDFFFTCVGIEEKRSPIILWGDHMRKCTPEWFQREITEFWKDQSGYVSFRNGMPKPDYSNTDFRPQSFTPCLMENYE
mgnify:FL=1